jgi:hypothetical protein
MSQSSTVWVVSCAIVVLSCMVAAPCSPARQTTPEPALTANQIIALMELRNQQRAQELTALQWTSHLPPAVPGLSRQ